MYNAGDIVCFEEYKFKNRVIDNKKFRPCVVLFSIDNLENTTICVLPLTSQTKSFNKNPNKYFLISTVVYNYEKLSFVKIDCPSFHDSKDPIDTGIKLSEYDINSLKEKMLRNTENEYIKKILTYNNLFEQLEKKNQAKEKKKIKKLKKQCKL